MAAVAITLLGGFAAAVDGEPVPERAWRLRKARELVKLLALARGRRLHREQAMDLLWPDRDPAAAANNLHQAVHVARRVLGAAAIETREEMLRLVADVDVELLERAAADARRAGTAAAYRAALSIYAGELLPENRYDDWASDRREELSRLHAELAGELASLAPAGDLPALPADASSFVGRSRELGELRSLLARTRLLTLVGTGGAGKTRLALELARGAEPDYAGGAALVELGVISDPHAVADATAAALEVRALPGRAPVDALADFLAPRTVLLLLDNCEHVLGSSAGLADALLRAAPGLTILATSREPLRVPGEVVFRVPSLAIPNPEQVLAPEELLRYEAVRLFVERAAAAGPGFALDGENAGDAARICFRLDGLPLAIELAASRVGALGAAAIADRLDDRFRLLRSGSHAGPARQQTLAATLDWSHELLDPDERVLLRRLAVFAGGFELAAVEAVCAGDGLDEPGIADLLARLVEQSLVAVDDAVRPPRYRLLETIRLYARARLDQAGESAALAGRHARWALALAERDRDLPGLDREAANLASALETVRAREPADALRFCVALWPFWLRRIELGEAERQLAGALEAAPEPSALRAEALLAAAAIDLRAGTMHRGRRRAEESLALAAAAGDRRAEWRALHFLGGSAITSDDGEDALRWHERGLALARREGFAAAEALGVYSLGAARFILGDLAAADELVGESIGSFRGLAGSPERIPSPMNLGELRTSDASDRPGLRIVLEETLQPFFEISCDAALGYALANQAGIARMRGDLERAWRLLDEAGERFTRAGDDRGRADVLGRRGSLELAEGSLDAARDDLERALELRRRQNDRRGVGLVLTGLGLVETAAGAPARAERHLAEARALFRRAGDRWGLTGALWRTADLALGTGRVTDAEAALDEARAVLAATQRDRWIAHTLARLAELAVVRGDLERAGSLLDEARGRYAARGDGPGVAEVEERLAELAKASQRPRKGSRRTTSSTRTTTRGGSDERDHHTGARRGDDPGASRGGAR